MPGVTAIVEMDGRLTCHVEGDMGPFMRAIAGFPITDLTIEPAHLEEAFLEYYEDAEANAPGPAVARQREAG